MNIFVPLVQAHPEVLDDLLVAEGQEVVSFDRLVDVVASMDDFAFALDGQSERVLKDEPLGPFLADAYLPVIPSEDWHARLESAADSEPSPSHDWVTFAEGTTLSRGVTVPDDDHAIMRVSLFSRVDTAVRRVSIEYANGPGTPPTALSMSLATGCSLPDWGECQTTECGGDCELRRRYHHGNGLVCWCPNRQQ